jgi:signal transduction histidine kinase
VGRSLQAMKTVRLRPRLGILFVLAVGLPSAALVVMAVRSIQGEEAVLEKRLERTLGAELEHVVTLVASAMEDAIAELGRAAPPDTGSRGQSALAAWKASSDLVGVPFLLTADDRLVEPSRERALSADEQAFLRWNEEFLAGSVQTPVYLNVGVAYLQEILAAIEADAGGEAAASTPGGSATAVVATADLAAEEKDSAGAAMAGSTAAAGGAAASGAGVTESAALATDAERAAASRSLAATQAAPSAQKASTAMAQKMTLPAEGDLKGEAEQPAPAQAPVPAAGGPAPVQPGQDQAVQEAVSRFMQDETVRKRVLEFARSEGATPVERNVQPQSAALDDSARDTGKAVKATEQPSIFVTRQRTFKEIQARASGGFLPRVVQDELELLFWVRTSDGGTAGCLVDLARLSGRLVALLPDPFTGERILTLLDESAKPIATPPEGRTLDWQRPFAALELHESLPRWEVASYLADPGLFASQVRVRTSLLWLLVAILVAAIGGGGTFVFLGLGHELWAAQQRTTFVANVSHELKTPLTSIRMFAEMLRDGRQADPERRQRYLDLMVAESGRLARLVNNVLDFSQLEQGRKRYTPRETDLVELCRGVLEAERPRLELAGFAVAFVTAGGPAPVFADEDALRQVLGNLLSNAEKYSTDRRDIGVDAGTAGGRPFFQVLDRGIGIPSEHAARIFREFYRVDDSLTARVKGTGLGLSIARRIVRDHGGELSYQPREGGGSAFRAEFPAAGERATPQRRRRGRGTA